MLPRSLVALALLALPIQAQILALPPGPFAPGQTITVTLGNNSAYGLPVEGGGATNGAPLALIHGSGQLITPRWMSHYGAGGAIPPGATWPLSFTIPVAGPGSSGSFVLYYPHGAGAALRLDVGTPAAAFPALCAFPDLIYTGYKSHLADYSGVFASGHFAIVNTSGLGHGFGPGDLIDIMPAGGTIPLATTSLAGGFVPANGRLRVLLPLGGLPVAPYTVQVSWNDPAAGPVVRRSGILPDTGASGTFASKGFLNLHLPGGGSLPAGGALPAYVTGQLSSVGAYSLTPAPVYALMLGIQGGSTTLPGGAQIALLPDPLVMASLTGTALGTLSNHLGTPTAVIVHHPGFSGSLPAGHRLDSFEATGISIAHPNVPGLSGIVLRAASILFEPTLNIWVPSPMEEVTLQ